MHRGTIAFLYKHIKHFLFPSCVWTIVLLQGWPATENTHRIQVCPFQNSKCKMSYFNFSLVWKALYFYFVILNYSNFARLRASIHRIFWCWKPSCFFQTWRSCGQGWPLTTTHRHCHGNPCALSRRSSRFVMLSDQSCVSTLEMCPCLLKRTA